MTDRQDLEEEVEFGRGLAWGVGCEVDEGLGMMVRLRRLMVRARADDESHIGNGLDIDSKNLAFSYLDRMKVFS